MATWISGWQRSGLLQRRRAGVMLGLGWTWPRLACAAKPSASGRRIGLLWHGLAPSSLAAAAHPAMALAELLRALGPAGELPMEVLTRIAPAEELEQQAQELVARRVDLIVANGTPAALAALKASRTVPLVFLIAGDPVELGLVASLSRPLGNATGIYNLSGELGGKRVGLLHEAAPRAARIGLLWTPNPGNVAELSGARAAARSLRAEAVLLPITTGADIEAAFRGMAQARLGALCVLTAPPLFEHLGLIADLATSQRLPAIAAYSRFAALGGLMSYAADSADTQRRLVALAAKVLAGARPALIPTERAQRFSLVLNLKTARAIGMVMPRSLMVTADRLIE